MITAVDTSVLLDVFGGDATHGRPSGRVLRQCRNEGRLIACAVVWAEVTAAFPAAKSAADALDRLGVDMWPMDHTSAMSAGEMWRRYRRQGGSRERGIADFLIGAHAAVHAERLLTRDRGFHRQYFTDLVILDPSELDDRSCP